MSDKFIKVWSTLCVTHNECLELLKENSSFEYSMKPIEQTIDLDLIEKFIIQKDFSKIVFTLKNKIRIYITFDCENIFELLMLSGDFKFVKKIGYSN
ncbi:MAG: hypothetical protein QQN41_01365 [Nitrosopumilus sp.]